MKALLEHWDDRLAWKKSAGTVTSTEVLRGSEDTALSVVVASSPALPTRADMQALWSQRAGRSADPVLVVVTYVNGNHERAAVLGVTPDAVPIIDLEVSIVERLIQSALAQHSPVALTSEMRRIMSTLRGGVTAGFRNEGLFASHVLEQQPTRVDWPDLSRRSAALLGSRGKHLLTGLGYQLDAVADGYVLRDPSADGVRRSAAVVLADGESLDNPLSRFHGSTAVTVGLALARREGVEWLILLGGPVARLFPADPDVGVGRKGQTQTYAEVDLSLLSDDRAGFLTLLFAPDALAEDGYVARLLAESSKYATGLSERLRDRIYEDVIPLLATSIANHHAVGSLNRDQQRAALDEAYHQAMIVLFRLLFVAYAEDRGFLPLDTNEAYTSNALKTQGRRILENPEIGFSATSTSMWTDLTQIWDIISLGNLERMGVPAYNGSLFTRDRETNPSGSAVYDLRLTDAEVGPVLRGLLIDTTPDGVLGMVDFRSLDVREFGTIYEGLLESGLGIAEADLTLDRQETYVPANSNDDVYVRAGEVYFHSRSGSRKATGSYFTKPFAVQHLLDSALEPTIDEHLERVLALLGKGASRRAAEALFDFRVTDLAMGSAHFLVAAVDRIEARFSAFLAENPIPEVDQELDALRGTAASNLGVDRDESGIDDGVLLRRLIARRCIYGVDMNEIAVELARLAVWIHTFVPGLPLSFLNHGLVHGNSLTGVGTLEEIAASLSEAEQRELRSQTSTDSFLLEAALNDFMSRAGQQLDLLARISDASVGDVATAGEAQQEIDVALEPLAALCDLITAERTTRHLKKDDPSKFFLSAGGGRLFGVSDAESLERAVLEHPQLVRAREVARSVLAAHLPVRFPEVLRRDRPGFDVVLGNPPWEKLKVEEDGWWGLRFPGLLSLPQKEKNAAIERYRNERPELVEEFEAETSAAKAFAHILTAGPFPGIGATDIDLFAAFCWRIWSEVRLGGRVGVVLPRSALSGSATELWRKDILARGAMDDVTMLTNTGRWAFDMEPRYTIALVCLSKGSPIQQVSLRGPFAGPQDYETGILSPHAPAAASVSAATVLAWSDTAAIPLIPAADVDVFSAMRRHPSLGADIGQFKFRPYTELHTTKEKRFYDFDLQNPGKGNTLPVWTGGSFNLWRPGSGEPYAYADSEVLVPFLEEKRANSAKSRASAFYEMPEAWLDDPTTLPMHHPRIAFRDVCRATDSRTMICTLTPPGVALVEKAPYLLRLEGALASEAYVLGVTASRAFDWFTRRYIEMKMSFGLLNSFPVPRVDARSGRRVDASGSELDTTDVSVVRDRVIHVSGRLAAVDERYEEWAAEVGVPVASASSDAEKQDLIDELDALVALLYGLSDGQVEKVFSTFHRGWDFRPRLDAVLIHYRRWLAELGGQGVLS